MPTITWRSPVRVPLLRAGTPKPVPPDPRAYESFRVTQTFDAPDSINPRVKHNATDIGNFRCGDTVVAMAPGIATRVKDNAKAARGAATDALGIIVDHGVNADGERVTSEYWHLSQWLVVSNTRVSAGQAIGSVGRTGLGNVCHLHVEIKVNGTRVDPEPYMFGERNDVFSDVDDDDPHKADIEFVAERGFMVGGSNGTFRPDAPITRREAATVFARILKATGHEDARR